MKLWPRLCLCVCVCEREREREREREKLVCVCVCVCARKVCRCTSPGSAEPPRLTHTFHYNAQHTQTTCVTAALLASFTFTTIGREGSPLYDPQRGNTTSCSDCNTHGARRPFKLPNRLSLFEPKQIHCQTIQFHHKRGDMIHRRKRAKTTLFCTTGPLTSHQQCPLLSGSSSNFCVLSTLHTEPSHRDEDSPSAPFCSAALFFKPLAQLTTPFLHRASVALRYFYFRPGCFTLDAARGRRTCQWAVQHKLDASCV